MMDYDLSLCADGKMPYETPGQRLGFFRKHLQFSVDEIVEQSGFCYVTIWKMENDDIPILNDYPSWLKNKYGVNEDWVWTGNGEMLRTK